MKLLFAADLVPTKVTEELFVNADIKALFGDIEALIKSADRTIVNLECALTHSENAIKKFGPNLKADPKCINGIKAVGITDLVLSNNHVFDFGCEGLVETMKTLDEAGMPYTGLGENDTDSRKPYFIELEGKKICIINVCEHEYTYATPTRMGANPFDPFITMQDIRSAKAQSDYVIVVYHGGKEHCAYPSPRLRNLCHEMVFCGADVVLTQHSHCIGCYEEFEGGHILYGQGNFNFVYPKTSIKSPGWYTSLITEVVIDDGVKVKFHPIVATDTGCDMARGEKANEIMTAFEARNKELLTGEWEKGWQDFCFDPERNYYVEIIGEIGNEERSRQLFAHYLDCEAHTDVWRELFKTWNHTNV